MTGSLTLSEYPGEIVRLSCPKTDIEFAAPPCDAETKRNSRRKEKEKAPPQPRQMNRACAVLDAITSGYPH